MSESEHPDAGPSLDQKDWSDLETFKKALVASRERSDEFLDKTITTLSGGAIGLSLVFLEKIQDLGGSGQANFRFMVAAWTAWVFAIVFSVLSNSTAVQDISRSIKDCDLILSSFGEQSSRQKAWERLTGPGESRLTKAGRWMGLASGWLFAVGATLLLIYVGQSFEVKNGTKANTTAAEAPHRSEEQSPSKVQSRSETGDDSTAPASAPEGVDE